jgi:octaheme c-type cytochrome (tetrathionate reductase family)
MNADHRQLLFLLCFIPALLLAFGSGTAAASEDTETALAPGRSMAHQATMTYQVWNTVDHSQHEALQKTFENGNQITEACLSCHNDAAEQFKKTIHWTWKFGEDKGKAGYSLNNFCISTNKQADKGCFKCHPGWERKTEVINCLACHGQAEFNFEEAFEDYQVFAADTDDAESVELAQMIQTDIAAAAQTVGLPGRKNCGSCHFYGGGGDGVKHGDLDSSMTKPSKTLDVHMGTDGQNFTCTRCHTTVKHNVAGRMYTAPAYTERKSLIDDDLTAKITCESCHSTTPHSTDSSVGQKANDHTDKVACQSCHIPTFARVNPTKMSWDWSTAGKLKDGKPYTTEDEFGQHDYMSIKGSMKWDKDVAPSYFWFNGSVDSVTLKDVVDPSGSVAVSHPVGSPDDPQSRIFPFKIHRGKQPYDKVNKTLLAPLLSTPKGYWTTFDMHDAIARGQEALGIPYSGQFDYVETTYVFPTTHMVAPKENVVACTECHDRNESRIADLTGFYMPGRDYNPWINTAGWVLVIGSLMGVTLHGLGRIFSRSNGNGRKGKNDDR